MDARVFAFAFCVALVAGALSGLTPALVAARANVFGSLKEGGRSAAESVRRRRVRAVLVVSEFATAFLLLVSAGLVLRSFFALIAIDTGFDPHHVLSMRVSLQGTSEAEPARRPTFFRDLLERVNALPGVESASAINHLPLHGDNWAFPFDIEGRPFRPPGDGTRALFRVVHPGYFSTMRIAVQRGRDFSDEDAGAGAHVLIINSTMARRHWPDGDPLGARITVDDVATNPEWYTVIGVVEDARQSSLAEPTSEEMYFP
jgi:putative ABC transport system permease protein